MAGTAAQCICHARTTIRCDGEYIPSEGLCLRHAVLFDYWIAHGGFRVYGFNPDGIDRPTEGPQNPVRLRRWKRAQFHAWLDTLTDDIVQQIEES